MSCTEAGTTLVRTRPPRLHGQRPSAAARPGEPDSNRSHAPATAPHGIYPAEGDDNWVAIACRDDDDWKRLAAVIDEPWATDPRNDTLAERARGAGRARRAHRGVDAHARPVRGGGGAPRRRRAGGGGRAPGGPHRPRSRHQRVGALADRAPPRDGRRARRRHPRAPLGDRLGRSSGAARASASTTDQVLSELLGLDDDEIEQLREGRRDVSGADASPGALDGCGSSSWRQRARRVRRASCSATSAPT